MQHTSNSLKKPDFYKSVSETDKQLEMLKAYYEKAPEHVKPEVEKDIKMLSYGIAGEKNIAFELNNSFLPLIVLHDLCLEYSGLTAQIDYLIITPKVNLVVECKNLVGNIEVNNRGEFIRSIKYGNKTFKEGIYSPISQNRRHLDLLKAVRKESKGNRLTKALFEKYFDENYRAIVVLANPKTIINLKYAKKEVKDQIIRADQLNEYIRKLMNDSKTETLSEKLMYQLADFYLSMHRPKAVDYTQRYQWVEKKPVEEVPVKVKENQIPLEETKLYKDLKQYRLETSRKEGIKAYMVFTNAQLEEIIKASPKNINELTKINGINEKKAKKYGEDIIRIIHS